MRYLLWGGNGGAGGVIFKWIYAATMETADWGWIEDALTMYFAHEGINISLGPSSGERTCVHLIKRYAKKVATNSALTAFKENQMKSWGFAIELHKRIGDNGSFPDSIHSWEAHNIEDMLDPMMKRRMTCVGGCVFLTRHSLPADPEYLVKCRINAAI